jgi:hypothetical protein
MNNKRSEAIKLAYKEGRKKIFQPNPIVICPDVKKLKILYLNKGLGSWKISKEFNVSQTLILKWLRDNQIEVRNLSLAAKLSLNGFKDGKKHPNWVGDKVSYPALHTWVRNHLGTPMKCEFCGDDTKRKYEWANKDHKYKRNLEDWVRLCTKCHREFDKNK